MRLHAVLFLVATLVLCSALCQWTTPTTTTLTIPSGVQAAIELYKQFKLQTNPGPSQDPNMCYTDNQEEGKCVKISVCALPPPKINANNIFKYRPSVWDNTDYLGVGTLIHPSVVITVAHKVDTMVLAPSDLKCRAGEWNTVNENESYEHQDREVQKIIVHEQFDKSNAYYDVALLIMKTPFSPQPHINVACLSQTMPPPGTLCYSMGWGTDFNMGTYNANVLKKLPMPLMPKHECERRFRKSPLGSSFFLHRSLTCAGGVPNIDTCTGDGGSSLVCPVGDPSELRYTVVGMVAYGMTCGSEFPSAYAKIPEVYNWVNQNMYTEGFYGMPYSI